MAKTKGHKQIAAGNCMTKKELINSSVWKRAPGEARLLQTTPDACWWLSVVSRIEEDGQTYLVFKSDLMVADFMDKAALQHVAAFYHAPDDAIIEVQIGNYLYHPTDARGYRAKDGDCLIEFTMC